MQSTGPDSRPSDQISGAGAQEPVFLTSFPGASDATVLVTLAQSKHGGQRGEEMMPTASSFAQVIMEVDVETDGANS